MKTRKQRFFGVFLLMGIMAILVIILSPACYDGSAMTNVDGVTVYIAGYYYDGGEETACYWKDGVRTDLPITKTSNAFQCFAITVK